MARIGWIETGHSVKLSRNFYAKKKKKKETRMQENSFSFSSISRSASLSFSKRPRFHLVSLAWRKEQYLPGCWQTIESLIAKLFGCNAFDVQTSRCSRILDNDREQIFSSSLSSIDFSYRRGCPFSLSLSLSLCIFYPKKKNIGFFPR